MPVRRTLFIQGIDRRENIVFVFTKSVFDANICETRLLEKLITYRIDFTTKTAAGVEYSQPLLLLSLLLCVSQSDNLLFSIYKVRTAVLMLNC